MNAISDAEARARIAEAEVRKLELEVRKAELAVVEAELAVVKAEIDADVRNKEIDADVRKAEIDAGVRKAEIEDRKLARAEAKAKRESESFIAREFLESIGSAWVARFLTTLKSSGLYQVIVFMFEFLSRVGKFLLRKSQTANTPGPEEVTLLLGSDAEE